MTKQDSSLEILEEWYEGLPIEKGFRVRGAIAAALQVLEKLKTNYSLDTGSHLTDRKGQVSGISGTFLGKILANFDEHRVFAKEGGRTNRGVIGYIDSLLNSLRTARLEELKLEKRNKVIEGLQLFLVDRVRDYHGRQRIAIEYDPSKTAWQTIAELLAKARQTKKDGPVAQYLVGAKLALRFPHIAIGNESYSTADDQLDRPGDFYVGNTAFHVTVAPLAGVYNRCLRNLQQGYRVFLLVTEQRLQGTKDNVDLMETLRGKVSVESIETFVSQNLEELSEFKTDELTTGFRLLFEKYNERVDAVETDKSLMIEIPPNLFRPT
jgi:hypothetical protein